MNNKTHTLNLNPIYFELVKNNEKILEGRLNKDKFQDIQIGDKIIFRKEPERIETAAVVVTDKFLFEDFDEMADGVDSCMLGFKGKSKQEIIDTYHKFYSVEDEYKYGVVIFKVKTI